MRRRSVPLLKSLSAAVMALMRLDLLLLVVCSISQMCCVLFNDATVISTRPAGYVSQWFSAIGP